MQIDWIDPNDQVPPFGKEILVVLGGTGSDDAGGTWDKYFKVCNAIITKKSPNDNDDEDEFNDFVDGGQKDYMDFQFYVYDYGDYKYGLSDEDRSDWFSDSIIRWAHMPSMNEFKE